jgi:hypothetical protein
VFVSGLFSPVDGIVPQSVKPLKVDGIIELHDAVLSVPSLISVLRGFGVATYPSIEILCLVGAFASLLCFVSSNFCLMVMFGIMWLCYYSLVGIVGTFHHQADDLLLEAGAVALMLCPFYNISSVGVSDNVFMLFMRWVLFR